MGRGGLLRAVSRNSREAAAWRLGPTGKTARADPWQRAPRGPWRGGALDGDVMGAGRRQGVAGEHRWGPGVAPGKKIGGRAHPIGGVSGGGQWGGAVDGGGAGMVVTDDEALALYPGEGESEVRWVKIDRETARSAAHRAGERRRRCGRNSGEGNGTLRAGLMDSDGVCHGVLRVGTKEGKRAEARRRRPAPFWEGAVGVGKPGRRVEEAGHEQGGRARG
jgi:hypothetical protein